MNITTNNKKIFTKVLFMLFLMSMLFTACKKDSGVTPDKPVEPPSADTMFNRLITVRNFGEGLPAGSKPDDNQDPIYFSLENNESVPIAYRKTDRWDLSFAGIYQSFIGGNNSIKGNLGEGGPGKGGVMILTKNFDEVTDIPADKDFQTGNGVVGTDDSGNFGQGIGYYLYDFSGTIKGDGSFEKQHIAYVIQDHRTIVVRTANGNYAKIQMLSIYKDLLDPTTWTRSSPAPYFTFKYVLAKAGSTKFQIK